MKKYILLVILNIFVISLLSCIFHPLPPFNNPNDPANQGEQNDGITEETISFSRDGVLKIYFEKIELGQQVTLGFSKPKSHVIFDDINGIEEGWISIPIHYTSGEPIVMFLLTEFSDDTFTSNDQNRCLIKKISDEIYELNWEDYENSDYNDIIVQISIGDYFEIPNQTITIDGQEEDWKGIAPVLIDDTGDSFTPYFGDIYRVYFAQDSNFIYWRMDTLGNNYDSSGDMSYRLYFLKSTDQVAGDTGLWIDYTTAWESIASQWNGSSHVNLVIPNNYAEVVNIAEMKVESSVLAGNTFLYVGAQVYNHGISEVDDLIYRMPVNLTF